MSDQGYRFGGVMINVSRNHILSYAKVMMSLVLGLFLMGCVATTSGYPPGFKDGVLTARYGADLPITIYYPQNSNADNYPAVIFNHGRSFNNWRSGHLTLSRDYALVATLNNAGYAVAVPVRSGYHSAGGYDDERISCNGPFKGEFEDAAKAAGRDINAAIQMVGGLKKIDSNRIAVAGYSAGGFGTLASMSSFPAGVRAVVSFHGGRCGKRGLMFNGIEYVSEIIKSSAQQSFMPVLFISGTRDNIIPTESVRHLRDVVCDARGASCKDNVPMIVVEGASHRLSGTISRMDNELLDFLDRTMN